MYPTFRDIKIGRLSQGRRGAHTSSQGRALVRSTIGQVFSHPNDIARAFHAIRYMLEVQQGVVQGRVEPSHITRDISVPQEVAVKAPFPISSEISLCLDLAEMTGDFLWDNLLEVQRRRLVLEELLTTNKDKLLKALQTTATTSTTSNATIHSVGDGVGTTGANSNSHITGTTSNDLLLPSTATHLHIAVKSEPGLVLVSCASGGATPTLSDGFGSTTLPPAPTLFSSKVAAHAARARSQSLTSSQSNSQPNSQPNILSTVQSSSLENSQPSVRTNIQSNAHSNLSSALNSLFESDPSSSTSSAVKVTAANPVPTRIPRFKIDQELVQNILKENKLRQTEAHLFSSLIDYNILDVPSTTTTTITK